MPNVKQYSDSNSKDGFYVTVNPGDGPINIQSRPVMDKIFEKLGFGEKTAISHNLCWALYDAGLLYTSNSLSTGDTDTGSAPGYNLGDINLDEDVREKLGQLLQQYRDNTYVDDLTGILERTDAIQIPDTPSSSTPASTSSESSSGSEVGALKEIKDEMEREISPVDADTLELLSEWNVTPTKVGGDDVPVLDCNEEMAAALNDSVPRLADFTYTPDVVKVDLDDGIVEYLFNLPDESFGRDDGNGDALWFFSFVDYLNDTHTGLNATVKALGNTVGGENLIIKRTYGRFGSVLESRYESNIVDVFSEVDSSDEMAMRRRLDVFNSILDEFFEEINDNRSLGDLFG